jgi:UDP-4-amino-4-deoxy-L-arabinose-oxoglutarate aminotransferase
MILKVDFYKHNIGEEEKRKVLECLDGIFITTGTYVKEFEGQFADYLNLKHAVGLTSCTAALHLSLLALGIGPGDEVITTPMTFIATATSIIHAGATPVLVDVEPATGLLDPRKIERAITGKTKAIIPVHLYGQMCDMHQIKTIADKYNLKIIEDSAHCIEAERDGVRPGQLGDVACFSFYATKNITSGEGGAIATNNKDLAEKIMLLRQHGMSKEAADRYSGNYQHWDMLECGWKYNMDNIQASLLLNQLRLIDERWVSRNRICLKYEDFFSEINGVAFPTVVSGTKSARHLFTIWVDPKRRDNILWKFQEQGIGVAVNYRAIHLLSYFKSRFKYDRGMYQHAEKIGDSTITIPLYPLLTDEESDYVCQIAKNII